MIKMPVSVWKNPIFDSKNKSNHMSWLALAAILATVSARVAEAQYYAPGTLQPLGEIAWEYQTQNYPRPSDSTIIKYWPTERFRTISWLLWDAIEIKSITDSTEYKWRICTYGDIGCPKGSIVFEPKETHWFNTLLPNNNSEESTQPEYYHYYNSDNSGASYPPSSTDSTPLQPEPLSSDR